MKTVIHTVLMIIERASYIETDYVVNVFLRVAMITPLNTIVFSIIIEMF
jgi:hypothetical protein